jgi:anion-transporting  ArsA/GET3 family ATPase
MSLSSVLDSHRVIVTVGSGGVGKTTTAAALAVHAAMGGKRVLCLTIDPARRLANSLGLSEMTTSEQDVPKALFEAKGLPMRGSLAAMMLDTKRTFDDLVTRNASSQESRDRVLNNKIYQYVSQSLAGTQEYMAMEKLHSVRTDPKWDLIVLDTPPTSNALDFLDAPERLVGAIDSPAMRWFVQAFDKQSGSLSFNIFGRGASLLLKGLSKFTGVEFLEQVAEFVSGLNELFGGFKERAAEVSEALRRDDVAFVVVTSPDPLAVSEAKFFSDRLKEAGIRHDAVVMNAVHELLPTPAASDAELAAAVRPHLPSTISAEDAVARMHDALRDERTRALANRAEAVSLKEHVGDEVAFVEVPALEEDVHDLETLSTVARHLTSDASSNATPSAEAR